jgi:hypothetical protein
VVAAPAVVAAPVVAGAPPWELMAADEVRV